MTSAGAATAGVMPDLWITLLKSGTMLLLVLAVLLGVLYWIRKLLSGQNAFQGQKVITPIATYHLAPKEKVVLLDVLGEKILIGITAQSINRLATIDSEMDPADLPTGSSKGRFARLLSRSLAKPEPSEKRMNS